MLLRCLHSWFHKPTSAMMHRGAVVDFDDDASVDIVLTGLAEPFSDAALFMHTLGSRKAVETAVSKLSKLAERRKN
jgi:hypothetical protein